MDLLSVNQLNVNREVTIFSGANGFKKQKALFIPPPCNSIKIDLCVHHNMLSYY